VTGVHEVEDPAERSRIAERVLRDLPDWFGIEQATLQYIEDAAQLTTFAVGDDAFLSLKLHTPRAAEIRVMGVRREQHRRGLGRALVRTAEAWCAANGVDYLQVKTLAATRPSEGYARTRAFYEACGFTPLEVFPELWDPANPALQLVKRVDRGGFTVFPVTGLPELREGDDLAALILERVELRDRDVVVIAQKAISKVEGRVVRLDDVEPSERAREIAGDEGDPHRVEWILREAQRVVRVRAPVVFCQTRQGFICASAGVDQSNTPEEGTLVLLPIDSDASAQRLRATFRRRAGRDVGVLVTDSFGRPWRQGTTDVAIGAAGIEVLRELSGERDPIGYELKATVIAVADELAGAAQLVSGKLDRNPVTIARGLDVRGDGRATEIPIPPERDLFG
jgi:coenzyme F420-0:L-glutamate ligase/coenzyme F420-1:gamma-L-glutamate ligase